MKHLPLWEESSGKFEREFPDTWIGRGGAGDKNISWPPPSPDLAPMDFLLW